MTYCIGWKTKNSVFVAADSAVTVTSPPVLSTPLSSVGEASYSDGTDHVYEGLLKTCMVDGTVLAFSGSVGAAMNVIETFEQLAKFSTDCRENLRRAVLSHGPYTKDNDIALIVAGYNNDGPLLISYNHDGKRNISDHDYCVQIGSIGSIYRQVSEMVIRTFLHGNLGDEHMLAAVTAVLQSYGIFDHMMRMNVGGVFFGASVDLNGVSWQKDTSYFLYPPDLTMSQFISVCSIDNALAVASSFVSPRVFMNTINTANVTQWQDKRMHELKEKLNSGKSIFYTFLSTKDRLITVIKKTDKSVDRYFRIHTEHLDGKEQYNFSFSSEFVELLSCTRSQESFTFNWRND